MPGVSPSTLPTDPTRRGSRSGASGGSALTATVSRGKPAGNAAALYIGIGIGDVVARLAARYCVPFQRLGDASVSPLETLSYRCRPPLGPLGAEGCWPSKPRSPNSPPAFSSTCRTRRLHQAGTRRHRRSGRLLQIANKSSPNSERPPTHALPQNHRHHDGGMSDLTP
jgi:hypothetical protein